MPKRKPSGRGVYSFSSKRANTTTDTSPTIPNGEKEQFTEEEWKRRFLEKRCSRLKEDLEEIIGFLPLTTEAVKEGLVLKAAIESLNVLLNEWKKED